MTDTSDFLILALVVGARFLVPLLIPFFPLPAIIAALLLDGVDQTIFQKFTNLPLDGYQGYDKALDIYYLSVAYISTFRNWTNDFAFRVSRFLYYYRLVGVVLFETLQMRSLLLVFPNTFEYFFIWYEAVKLWWNPRKLSRTAVISAAAAIWIVIKLPQEYWLHVAQNDVTDAIKVLLGGTPDSPWGPLLFDNLLLILLVLLLAAVAIIGLFRLLRRNTPPTEHALGWRADDNTILPTTEEFTRARRALYARIFDIDLLEKIVLAGFIIYIFATVLPGTSATGNGLLIYVAALVIATTAISHAFGRRGTTIASGVVHFLAVFVANMGLAYLLLAFFGRSPNWANVVVFQLLLAVIVTLFDRLHPYREARFPRGQGAVGSV
ncbi:MAG: hypothetical protein KA170_02450 [Candidatus Promineofilum sp.]|nr:hypothetical protein [Promineifilum sp.]